MDGEGKLSPFEFEHFIRNDLKLSHYDVMNEDLQSFYTFLDRNGDGRVNDGSELFGALSGNGFTDLAELDDDGNGWIDESDEVFDRLRIWSRDEAGREQLVALGARGVGALYLGHIATPFEIKTPDNQLTGVVRQTGLYLQEEGGAGALQQIDLVV